MLDKDGHADAINFMSTQGIPALDKKSQSQETNGASLEVWRSYDRRVAIRWTAIPRWQPLIIMGHRWMVASRWCFHSSLKHAMCTIFVTNAHAHGIDSGNWLRQNCLSERLSSRAVTVAKLCHLASSYPTRVILPHQRLHRHVSTHKTTPNYERYLTRTKLAFAAQLSWLANRHTCYFIPSQVF